MGTKVEISKKLILVNSASSVAERVVNITVLVWLNQYLLRRISPEEYSLYPVVMAIMMFVPLLTVVLTSGLGRYIVEAYAKDDERRVTEIVSTMFPLLLGAGILLMIGGGAFAWNVHRFLTVAPHRIWDARIMLGLLMFSAAVRVPLSPFGVGLYVRQKFLLLNVLNVCVSFFRIALLFILVLGVSTRVLWVVVASVGAELCGLIVRVVISCRLVPALRFRLRATKLKSVGSLLSFGTWNLLLGVSYQIVRSADAIILNKLATPMDVTTFHLGTLCRNQIEQGVEVVTGPLSPALTAAHAQGNAQGLRSAYLRVGRYALWTVLAIAVPLMIYAQECIALYVGDKYATAATVMILMFAAFPLRFGNVMLWKLAAAKGQLGPAARRSLPSQIVNLGLTFYFVGGLKMGAIGSALATLIVSVIAMLFLTWPLGLRMADTSFRRWFSETLLPGWLPAIAGGVIWIVLKIVVEPATWANLAACFVAGLVCYCATLFLVALQPRDRGDLRAALILARRRILGAVG